MTALLLDAALLVTAAGLVSATLVLGRTRDLRVSMKVLLEFLLAAGLLRLTHEPTWRKIAVAAGIVGVRRLLSFGLAQTVASNASHASQSPPG